ncbi:hypothetical protein ACWDSJ_25820 [Nocardia sp. NPDC003482]
MRIRIDPGPSPATSDTTAESSCPAPHSATPSDWSAVAAGVGAGPVAGIALVLLAKPLAGVAGIPGVVSLYLAVTAFVLAGGTGAAMLLVRRGVPRLFRAGCGLLAGVGLVTAGSGQAVAAFAVGVLVTGAATGPLLIAGRVAVLTGERAVGIWYAVMAAGLVGGSVLAGACARHPGYALSITGAVVLVTSIPLVINGFRRKTPCRNPERATVPWPFLPAYLTAGAAAGLVVLPTLHLLLFRWNVLDAEQWRWLALAAAPAPPLVLPRRRSGAVAPLLLLAAGGAVLIATAPGVWTLVVGLAVTVAALGRALAALDDTALAGAGIRVSAATALAGSAGALTGLGTAAGLSRWWGTGSALTVGAALVALAAVAADRLIGRTS